MPVPVDAVPWSGSLAWFALLLLVSFAVSWLGADRLHLRRAPYIAVLAAATAAMAAGYVAWSGLDVADVVLTNWVWGLVVAPFAGAFLVVGMRRLPGTQKRSGAPLAAAALWEGLVYGVAEGLLLSALPVLMVWEAVHDLGWSGLGGWLARAILPIAASVAVVVVHHLGYWEYRNRLLVPISVGCGLMSVGYLVTGSPLAPVVAHVLSHLSAIQRGVELPPHERGTYVPTPAPREHAGSTRT